MKLLSKKSYLISVSLFSIGILIFASTLFMGHNRLGKYPKGERLERIKNSPNYRNGEFKNLSHTPPFGEGYTMGNVIYEKLFKKFPNLKPTNKLPSVKTNLLNLNPNDQVLVWFGHSSYFMQIDGKRILVDPIFSGNASPLPNTIKAFKGADAYTVEDLPSIDYLFITHDHYDHLDYKTIKQLKDKVGLIICGLGVGAHLESWGYDPTIINEFDWYDDFEIATDLKVFVQPARHFSGRSLKRNNTLWVSYVLKFPSLNIYLGGDSGFDSHFADIGEKYGPFDFAVLENGQYNKAWPYVHETPAELLKAAQNLKAKRILPVHSGKFSLSIHPWYEPLSKVSELNISEGYNFPIATPMIGQVVHLDDIDQKFDQWWVGLE